MRRSARLDRPLRNVLLAPPGDAAALETGADAVLYDLVGAGDAERAAVAAILRDRSESAPLVLLKASKPDEGGAETLAALAPLRPDAIVTTGAETGADLQQIGALLAVAEAKAGLAEGAIGIVAMAETTGALFGLIGFKAATQRLLAIGWDGEALGEDFGGETPRETDGRWSDPLQTARTLALAAASDAKLPAIDSRFSTRDSESFRREAERARRDGFAGKVALDAAQAAIIREVFGES